MNFVFIFTSFLQLSTKMNINLFPGHKLIHFKNRDVLTFILFFQSFAVYGLKTKNVCTFVYLS